MTVRGSLHQRESLGSDKDYEARFSPPGDLLI